MPTEQLPLDFSPPPIPALLSPDEIFDRATVELLTSLREDKRIERKPAGIHARELGDYFSMWANTQPDGGVIVVGMEDKGAVTGCLSLDQGKLNELETAGRIYCADARWTSKRIAARRTSDGGEDFLLLFRVLYKEEKVVETASSQAFVRRGESKFKLSTDEVRELQIDKGQLALERELVPTLTYPDDFDTELIDTFAQSVRAKRELAADHDNTDVLRLMRLLPRAGSEVIPTTACVLLFAKDPGAVIPGCRVRFLRFDGTEEGTGEKFNAVKDIWIDGNIPRILHRAAIAIKAQVRDFTRLGRDGRFFTAPEYPDEVWYEAVVNACAHRSYGLRNMPVFVKMFDDRLIVESPGGFPPFVTPANIYDTHHPRNPTLMEALYYLDFVKCAHEGTRRMRDTMARVNLPEPQFQQKEIDASIVRVTLRNDIAHRKIFVDSEAARLVGDAVFQILSDRERLVINYIAEHYQITVSDVTRLTGTTWKTSAKLLNGLKAKGILDHIRRSNMERDTLARYVLRRRGKQSR